MESIPTPHHNPNPNPSKSLFADKAVRVIAIVAGLSLLGLGGIYLKIYFVKPSLPSESKIEYVPEKTVFGDGTTEKPYIVTNTEDQDRKKYEPQNLQIAYQADKKTIRVSWEDPEMPKQPSAWLIGFWHETFNPVEKFNVELLKPEEKILWKFINSSHGEYIKKTKTLELNLGSLPVEAKKVYFYMYVRIEPNPGTYVDYIYGKDGKPTEALEVDITAQ